MTTTQLNNKLQTIAEACVCAYVHNKKLASKKLAKQFIKLMDIKYYNTIKNK